jgi:hypothetical protein
MILYGRMHELRGYSHRISHIWKSRFHNFVHQHIEQNRHYLQMAGSFAPHGKHICETAILYHYTPVSDSPFAHYSLSINLRAYVAMDLCITHALAWRQLVTACISKLARLSVAEHTGHSVETRTNTMWPYISRCTRQ